MPKDSRAAYALMKEVLSEMTYYPKASRVYELAHYKRYFLSFIKASNSMLLGAFESGKMIGLMLAYEEYGGLVNIDWLIVGRNHRGKGIGERLMKRLEIMAKRRGMHKIYGDTEIQNRKAQAFDRKMGYRKVATLMDWNFHEDRYVWEKNLTKHKRLNNKLGVL